MKTKLLLLVLPALLFVMTWVRPEGPHPASPDTTTITFSFWGSYTEWNMWRDITAAFESKHPEVFVKLNYIPGGYDDKIQLLLAADSAPDVMMIQDEPFPGYAAYGKFYDLTSRAYGPDAPIDWDHDLWPTTKESFLYKGRVMGMPLFGGNVLVYYNRAMFRKLGVAPPNDNWTFDEFIAKAKELTRDLDGDGKLDTFGFMLPHWIYFLPWTWGYGARYLNDTNTDWIFTGPEAVAATALYQDLRFKYHVSPSIQEVPVGQESTMFMTGRIGMMVGGPWTGLELSAADVDFDVVHIPIGPTGKRFTRVTWDSLCMFAKTPHPDAAWKFMAFCIGLEGQSIVGKYVRSIPVLKAAKDSFLYPDQGWRKDKFFDALDYARLQPISVHWDKMRQVLDKDYEMLLLNKLTPEETVTRINTEMRQDHIFPLEPGS